MVNEQYQKSKQQLAYSRKQVEKAGRIFRKNEGDFDFATEVIQNYRAAHLYPLTIIKNLVWKHVKKLHLLESATIVRRLKRLPTIIDKLQRTSLDGKSENAINLKRMHDKSLDSSRTVHGVKSYDYINKPKSTGYRGIHRVYKSYNNLESHDYKGFQIEVQLRTKLQHLWATTVEIVDIIEKETLKTNPQAADTDWKRLFFIMGEFLAVKDGSNSLSKEESQNYIEELASLNKKLAAFQKLDAFNRAFQVDEIKNKSKDTGFALLVHNTETQMGRVFLYAANKKQEALTHYAEQEKQTHNNVLLVAGNDLKSIEKAYPNYLNDTSEFLSEFSRILLG